MTIKAVDAGPIVTTIDIVAAYVANNSIPVAGLPALIAATHAAIAGLGRSPTIVAPAAEQPTPDRIRKSITHEALISFEDGRPYRTLRRHLSLHGLTPGEYRAKWGLPADYPMTAPGYSEARSALAKRIGLGVPGAQAARRAASEVAEALADEPKRAGRPRKAAQTA